MTVTWRELVSGGLILGFLLLAWVGGVGLQSSRITGAVSSPSTTRAEAVNVGRPVLPCTRRVLSGIGGVDLNAVFSHPTEVYLSNFAQPGAPLPSLDRTKTLAMLDEDLTDALDDELIIESHDTQATSELKGVVAGLKEEVAMLLCANKSLSEICDWFEARQRMESEYRRQRSDRFGIHRSSVHEGLSIDSHNIPTQKDMWTKTIALPSEPIVIMPETEPVTE